MKFWNCIKMSQYVTTKLTWFLKYIEQKNMVRYTCPYVIHKITSKGRHAEIEVLPTRPQRRGAACSDIKSGSDEWFPPKQSQAVARRLMIGRRERRRRRARKAAGFPANNAKWCICQGEFVHRRRRAPRAPPSDIRHSIRPLRADRRSTEGNRVLISLRRIYIH